MKLPHLIALSGHPKSGKSLVQDYLRDEYGVVPVDDGRPMRQFAIQFLGLSEADCYTQEGKARISKILGRDWQNRKILGELGKRLEAMFGPHIMPFMATRGLDEKQCYSFGSVRRDQGAFYKAMGGIVIGIDRPGI